MEPDGWACFWPFKRGTKPLHFDPIFQQPGKSMTSQTRPSARIDDSSLSMYRLIEAILREQIVSGEYARGDRLPTEAQLSAMFRASRPTVRQALHGLEAEKLVRKEQGRGTFVRATPSIRMPDRYAFSIGQLIEPSAPIRVAIQRSGAIKGRGIAHEMMRSPPGTELFYFVRIYSLGARPIGGSKVHVPMRLRDRLRAKDMLARNFPQTLAERSGLHLSSSVLDIDATLAEPRFAEMLKVRAGAPLMSVRRTTYDRGGAAIEHSHMLFRPDLCHLTSRHVFQTG